MNRKTQLALCLAFCGCFSLILSSHCLSCTARLLPQPLSLLLSVFLPQDLRPSPICLPAAPQPAPTAVLADFQDIPVSPYSRFTTLQWLHPRSGINLSSSGPMNPFRCSDFTLCPSPPAHSAPATLAPAFIATPSIARLKAFALAVPPARSSFPSLHSSPSSSSLLETI